MLSEICKNAGYGLVHCVGVSIMPVVGVVAVPILSIKAIACWVLEKHYSEKTKNNYGVPLKTYNKYMDRSKKYEARDIILLESECKRIECAEMLERTITFIKNIAKCIIPVFGYVWFVKTQGLDNCIGAIVGRASDYNGGMWDNSATLEYHINGAKNGYK